MTRLRGVPTRAARIDPIRAPAASLSGCHPSERQAIVSLVLLVALIWQSLILPAHLHRPPPGTAAATLRLGNAAPSLERVRPYDDPAACPICRLIAHAGHYLSPAPTALTIPFDFLRALGIAPFLVWPSHHRPHGWQGRGPPGSRQSC